MFLADPFKGSFDPRHKGDTAHRLRSTVLVGGKEMIRPIGQSVIWNKGTKMFIRGKSFKYE